MGKNENQEVVSTPQPQPVQATTTPTPVNQPSSSAGGLAIAALVIGIISVLLGWVPFLGFILGVTAIILSIVALKKKQNKGMSITGIITGALAVIWSVITSILLIVGILGATMVAGEFNNELTGLSQGLSKVAEEYKQEQKKTISSKKDFDKGEVAKFNDFDVKVNSITRNYTKEYYEADEGKEYIVINFSVKNITDDSEYFSVYDLKIKDDGVIDSKSYISVDDELDSDTLAAGGTTTGNLVYEVTKDSKDLKIQYEDYAFDEDYNYNKLTYTLDLY